MTVGNNEDLKQNLSSLRKLLQKYQVDASDRALYITGIWLCMLKQSTESQEESKINSKTILSELKEYMINKIPNEVNKKIFDEYKRIFSDRSHDIRLSEDNLSETQHIYYCIYHNFFQQKEKIELETGWPCLYLLQSSVETERVYSPFDLAKFMADIAEIDGDSCILEPCAGSGGLLLAADRQLHRVFDTVKGTLTGIEIHFKSYVLAVCNRIAEGMNCQLYWNDWYKIKNQLSNGSQKYDRLLINPDFGTEDKGWKSVKSGLDMLEKGGIGVALVQNSPGNNKAAECAREILKQYTLCGCIKMSVNLFYPIAKVQTSIFIFRAGIPHDYEQDVVFVNFENDGQKQGKGSQIKDEKVKKQYLEAAKAYKKRKSVGDIPVILDKISDKGDDWMYEKHVQQDTELSADDFDEYLSDFFAFELNQMVHSSVSKMKFPEKKMAMFAIKDLFLVKSSKYPKEEIANSENGTVRVISNSAKDNGVKAYSSLPPSNPGNVLTLSSTTNENRVFYQDQPFIGFPHLVVLNPKTEIFNDFNKYIGLYMVGAIQKAKKGRYNYTSKFNNKEIKKLMVSLPVNDRDEIDCQYMEDTIRKMMSEKIEMIVKGLTGSFSFD